jgi:hypothetical protein
MYSDLLEIKRLEQRLTVSLHYCDFAFTTRLFP